MEHRPIQPAQLLRTLRAAAPTKRADPTTREQILKFVEWATPHAHAWTHVRVAAVAFRPGKRWVSRAMRVELTSRPTGMRKPMQTKDHWTGERCLPIATLSQVLKGIAAGRLPAALSPLRQTILVSDGQGVPFSRLWGSPHDAKDKIFASGADRFHRYELLWECAQGFASHFEPAGAGHDWLERTERTFAALEHGTLAEVGLHLGVIEHREQFWWDRPMIVKLVAPVPMALDAVDQSADRRTIEVRLLCEPGAKLKNARVALLPSPASERSAAIVPDVAGVLSFPSPTADKATVQLSYGGQVVHRAECEVLPPLRSNVRLTALHAFERTALFDDGIPKDERQLESGYEDAFERSVAHLLGILGFSSFWWGKHSKGLTVPQDQADILAISSDDTVVLVVDVTIRPSKDTKSSLLITRSGEIEAKLREVSALPPRVVPVLAVGVPLERVPNILTAHDDLVVLARDHIDAALALARTGAAHREIASKLPEALRAGFSSHTRYRLWRLF